MSDTASSSTLRLRKALDAAKAALDRIPGAGGQEAIMDDIRSASSGLPTHDSLTSLTFSHVQYTDDGLFSKIMAYTTLSPLWIICAYAGVILNGRDIKVALMFAGQLLNELLNLVLKRLVRQSRPTGEHPSRIFQSRTMGKLENCLAILTADLILTYRISR